MTTQLFQSGGVQTTTNLPQIIYLDFDGELTRYNGELLTLDSVTVEGSGLSEERIAVITAILNRQFRDQNVAFVTEKPAAGDYSTIFIGKTSSFAPYGSFDGLAETVDSGNKIRNDNAFVMLDSLSSDDRIADVIAHEAGHLLGTLDHGGEGLMRYADYYVSSGGISNGIVLDEWVSMSVWDGGIANNTEVNSCGYLYVGNSGTANCTTVNSAGSMSISSGGTANSTTVNSGGQLHVYSSGTANSTTVNKGVVYVSSGGTADSITMSGGYLNVYSGGTANNVIWTPCVGAVGAEDGAVVTYASAYSGVYYGSSGTLLSSAMTMSGKIISGYSCSMYVMSGGVANSTTANSGGWLFVSSGGVANSTTVNSRGHLDVFSGGTASNTTVNGSMYVFQGGIADRTTVNFDGCLYISSGGTAYNIVWTPCEGHIYDSRGAVITYVSSYSGIYFGRSETLLSRTMQMTGKRISEYESMYVMSGGIADSTSVINRMYIWSDGIANSTVISSGGSLFISKGGRANYTTINGDALLRVDSGGVANSTTVSGHKGSYFYSRGSMCIMSGGTANRTAVQSGGSLYVSSGGTANYVRWTPCVGVVCAEDGAVVTYASNYSGVYWGSGDTLLSSAVKISCSVVSGVDWSIYVMNGGTADSITNSWGKLYISSGGVANYTANYGSMYIFNGGKAENTANCSMLYVSSGGSANNTDVALNGTLHVFNGGVADNTTMSGGNLYVSNGGVAKRTTISGYGRYGNPWGTLCVLSGGTANSTTVNGSSWADGGHLYVTSGGVANSTTLNAGGHLYVYSGGTANSTAVNSGGIFMVGESTIYDAGESWGLIRVAGGTANCTAVYSSGGMTVLSGGVANSTTVNPYGHLRVFSSGTANNTTVSSGGSLYVSSGGTALSVKENGGYVSIEGDAEVSFVSNSFTGLVLERAGATIHSGTTANSTTVNSGGWLYVYSGGVISGSLEITSGSLVHTYYGAVVDFTVAEQTAPATALINDWSLISGRNDAIYTLTIKADQAAGTYRLADDASGFSKEITVKTTDGMQQGTLAVGETLSVGNRRCTLSLQDGSLSLLTVAAEPITITADSADKIYDGTALNASGYTYTGTLMDGDELVVTVSGSQTDAGVSVSTVTGYKVMHGVTDVTGNYTFNDSVNGTLTVTKRNVTLTSENDSKVYDGTPLINHNVTITGDGFAEGEGASCTFTGSQTEVGSSENTFSYTLSDGTKADNYNVTVQNGMLTVSAPAYPYKLQGSDNGISWVGTANAYRVEYSTDQYRHILSVQTAEYGIDTFAMPEGSYLWRVRNSDSETWSESAFAAEEKTAPESYVSEANGRGDIFFADGFTVWKSGYAAEHVGCGSWSGTGEQVELAGKIQITDVFEGSSDANILVMTDDTNGDALFVDDIYSAFPDELQPRIAQIDEIRAGSGDDVVDMTSQRFAYSGDGLVIRGGDGNDTIWANSGSNKLFGDAGTDRIVGASGDDVIVGGIGNDSMHGGGGDDIFCFCKGWGTDTVEQLSGGSVTLWFASGSAECWDQDTMTYLAGKNSVHVSGVTQVTLKFGNDGSALYDELLAAGAFMEASSEKIWEEPGKGVLAKL